MNLWPQDISIEAFKRTWSLEGEPLWHRVFEMHRDKMQIKNPRVAIANLEKIFRCTFRLANSKGFQAMSLRDLSRDTGISMGGLYAYIGSKDDLASVIEEVLRRTIDEVMSDPSVYNLPPLQRVKAIVYGDIYMNDIMHPWYYFCNMEAKGLSREQRESAMQIELKFDERLKKTFDEGVEQGLFESEDTDLLAAHTTAMLQQWYLKRWKFQLKGTSVETYAAFVYKSVLQGLNYQETAVSLPHSAD